MALNRPQALRAEVALSTGVQRRLWQCSGWLPVSVLSLSVWWPVWQGQTELTWVTLLSQIALLALGVSVWRWFGWPSQVQRLVSFEQQRWRWLQETEWRMAPSAKAVQVPGALGLPWRRGQRIWVFADECVPEQWRRLNVWARFTRQQGVNGRR